MKKQVSLFFILTLLFTMTNGFAGDDNFDSEKMLSELEQELKLKNEQLAKLKPTIDAKSEELKKSIHETVDKGFVELGEMKLKLDKMSKDAESKVAAFLNSEEMQKLKDYLSRIDEDAIKKAKDLLVAEITEVLVLTEEQVVKLQPVLEESMDQLAEMTSNLAREGSKSWVEFKNQYDELSQAMKEKMKDTLNGEQLEKFEKYNEDKKEKIHQILFVAKECMTVSRPLLS